jgi:hypothetical protein
MPPSRSKKDLTAMLVGHYDPPSLDYVRAIEGLRADGYSTVFLCPVSSGHKDHDKHVMAMAGILSVQASAPVVLCSVGLDKGLDGAAIRLWLEKRHPEMEFKIAFLSSDPQGEGTPIVIGNISKSSTHEPIYIPRHLSCQVDVVKKIGAGGDESRSFPPLIWNYIRKHDLYMSKEAKDASPTEIH